MLISFEGDNELLKKDVRGMIKEKTKYVSSLLLIFATISFFFPYSTIISGSMTPTLRVKDFVVSTRFINKNNLTRGDIILFYEKDSSFLKRDSVVKRIIGLPGEKVSIIKGVVYVNGEPIVEDYVNNKDSYFTNQNDEYMSEILIPENEYFVLGDNRRNSIDSRIYGCIKKSQISKRVIFIYSNRERKIKFFN